MNDPDAPSRIPIFAYPPRPEAIAEATRALSQGALIALATETVFGIAADASMPEAVQALYRAKGRQADVPLQILVPDLAVAEMLAQFTEAARAVATRYWPGPLTMVLPLRRDALAMLAAQVRNDNETIGIRIPAHPVAQALLHAYGAPLAASSANRSGQPAAHNARHAADAVGYFPRESDGPPEMQALHCILDGPCDPDALASTILDFSGTVPRILREGKITAGALGLDHRQPR